MKKTVNCIVFGAAMAAVGWFGRQLVPSGAHVRSAKGEESVSVVVTN